ncbi:MAG: glycosyl hydrolase family 18 protein [Thermincolia bacterium]
MKKCFAWMVIMIMVTFSVTGYTKTAEAFAYGERTLYQGLRGDDVKQLQKDLAALKLLSGKIDGVFGKGTRQGVINFQRVNGLNTDGVVGKATYTKINQKLGRKALANPGTNEAKPSRGKVNVSAANLRSGPGVWNKAITTVKKGTQLNILAKQGNWLKVKLVNNTTGWIAAKLVTMYKPEPVSRGREPVPKPPVQKPPVPNPINQPPSSGQPSEPIPVTKKTRNVLGFYTNPEGPIPGSLAVAQTHSGSLSAIAPFWFRLDRGGQGKISSFDNLGFTPAQAREVIKDMKSRNVKVLVLVHNMLYGSSKVSKNLAAQMLATPESRKVFIDEAVKVVQDYGFDGINVDIEDINMADRDKFSSLIAEMSTRLKPSGYILTVSVPAKVKEDKNNTWSAPFDYAAIGRSADQVMIMSYDEHGYSSGPGPIASVGWVEAVIKYALTTMPANKIMLGVPAYGFDWTVGVKGPKYLSYDMAMNLAKQTKQTVLWDAVAKGPYFKYTGADGKSHEVRFENGQSTVAKLELVDKYDLRGIAVWRLGMEDPAVWQVIRDKIQAEK